MKRKTIFIISISVISVILIIAILISTATPKETYSFNLYTKEETLNLYYENEQLFNDVVQVVINEPRFWEECRSPYESYSDAMMTSPYDTEIDVFTEKDKQIILDFFELRPYMINYKYSKKCVKLTFIDENQESGRVFMYWIAAYGLEDEINRKKSQGYTVEKLSGSWYFYYFDDSIKTQ